MREDSNILQPRSGGIQNIGSEYLHASRRSSLLELLQMKMYVHVSTHHTEYVQFLRAAVSTSVEKFDN